MLPSGETFTTKHAGFDDTIASDADTFTGQTDPFFVPLGALGWSQAPLYQD